MKITRTGENSFQLEMTPEDASEAELQQHLRTIILLAKDMDEHGTSREGRFKDRGGYWRYCQNEKSLMLIRDAAAAALKHIEWLDFPEDPPAASRAPEQSH